MHHGELHPPPAQVLPHGRISDAGVQIAGFKLFHKAKAVLGGSYSDPAQKFIDIHIGQRCGDPVIFPFPDAAPPGEIPPEQIQVQVVVCRKVSLEFSSPGHIVFIIFHKAALPQKIPAFVLKGAVPEFIELHHLKNARRDLRSGTAPCGALRCCTLCRSIRAGVPSCRSLRRIIGWSFSVIASKCLEREQCIMVFPAARIGSAVRIVSAVRSGSLLQYNCISLLPGAHSSVEQCEHSLRIRAVVDPDTDPLGPLHPKCSGKIRRFGLCKALPAAFDITSLEFCPGLIIPLAHQKSDPLVSARIGQNREARKCSPFVLLLHVILFFSVCRQFR